jgi:organic hydroperoxide reductase OsmC/OhrA
MSSEDGLPLMQAALEICPYAKALRGNVVTQLFVD